MNRNDLQRIAYLARHFKVVPEDLAEPLARAIYEYLDDPFGPPHPLDSYLELPFSMRAFRRTEIDIRNAVIRDFARSLDGSVRIRAKAIIEAIDIFLHPNCDFTVLPPATRRFAFQYLQLTDRRISFSAMREILSN